MVQVRNSLSFLQQAYQRDNPLYTRIDAWYKLCMASKYDEMTMMDMRKSKSDYNYVWAHMLHIRNNAPYLGKRYLAAMPPRQDETEACENRDALERAALTFVQHIRDMPDGYKMLLFENKKYAFKYKVFVDHFGLSDNNDNLFDNPVYTYLDTMRTQWSPVVASEAALDLTCLPGGYIAYMIQKMARINLQTGFNTTGLQRLTTGLQRLGAIKHLLNTHLKETNITVFIEKYNELIWNCNNKVFMKECLDNFEETIPGLNEHWTDLQVDAVQAICTGTLTGSGYNQYYPIEPDIEPGTGGWERKHTF